MSFFSELRRRNVVRVAIGYLAGAWFLAQIADIVVPAYGLPEAWIGILITVLGIGLIPVLVGAWLYELTPEGLQRDTGDGTAAPDASHRKFDRIVMALLALAVGFFAFDKFMLEPGRDAELAERIRADALIESYGERSIAVLPFANLSGDPDESYFSDGISEEILNLLAKIRDLRVISRSTSFTYRGNVNIQEVASELDVTYVLEGSVRKAGDTYRITAQLIDARSDSHVWSDTFDRSGDDIFAMQDELAQAVADALHVELRREREPRYETDAETYALYLRARHLFYGYSPSDQERERPIRMLRTVLERDPDYVPPMLDLAHILWYEARSGAHGQEQAAEIEEERIGLIHRALSISPNNAMANAAMSWHSIARQHDPQAAARYIQRALELDPNELEVLRMAGTMADALDLDVDKVELMSRALTRDMLCVNCMMQLADAYDENGEPEKAEEIRRRRIELAGDPAGEYQLAYSLMDTDPAAALEFFQSRPRSHGVDHLAPQVELLLKLGRRDEAEQVQQEMVEEFGDEADILIASGFAHLGQLDKSWHWFQRALEKDPELFVLIYEDKDNLFPGLHDTERWKDLRKAYGLSEEQLAKVEFEMPDLGPE